MNPSSVTRLVEGFSRQGRELLERYFPTAAARGRRKVPLVERLETLARALLSSRGEASGVAIASDLLDTYATATEDDRHAFFQRLAEGFDPDPDALAHAWTRYREQGAAALPELAAAVEAPRQELLRRINFAPGGTAGVIAMRADLLRAMGAGIAGLERADADFVHLLQSWFNRGFLKLRAITWSSPASLLEKLVRYEAVHDIRDWADLRRRTDPSDRRCYGFFHPSLPDDPLIFVEVALMRELADDVQAILAEDRVPLAAETADTAIFYSISNCQPGLKGISFGHFLIKQVATDLKRDLPGLERFATLSPVPGFRAWLRRNAADADAAIDQPGTDEARRAVLLPHVVRYFVEAKTGSGKPVDPVARFHLGNGARLERLNWQGDRSARGLAQSGGIMVNYLYDLDSIAENHEAYAHRGEIALGAPFRRMAQQAGKAQLGGSTA